MTGEPLARMSPGETIRIKIDNDTAFPHAMHLHGMHFHEMDAGGQLGAFRDTTLIDRGDVKEIAFVQSSLPSMRSGLSVLPSYGHRKDDL